MKRKLIIIAAAIVVVATGAVLGIRFWLQESRYVSTDNAMLNAPIIAVSSLASGQVISVSVDVGDRVNLQQTLAEVGSPRYSDPSARQGFNAVPDVGTSVQSPIAGYVAAVWTYPGAIVAQGSPIVTLFDPTNIWVTANIDENKIDEIHPGQEVEVTVDCLGGGVIKGKVQGISPSTSSFVLLPQSSSSTNFIKVAQVVPVKIALDNTTGLSLVPGGSVEVKIHTQ